MERANKPEASVSNERKKDFILKAERATRCQLSPVVDLVYEYRKNNSRSESTSFDLYIRMILCRSKGSAIAFALSLDYYDLSVLSNIPQ